MIRLLERLLAWLERQSGAFQLTEPVVVQHGASWVRLEPGRPPRWFSSEEWASRG